MNLKRLYFLSTFILLMLIQVQRSVADNFYVYVYDQDSEVVAGTLRYAIKQALNTGGDNHTILFASDNLGAPLDADQTIVLTEQIEIKKPITIRGSESAGITIGVGYPNIPGVSTVSDYRLFKFSATYEKPLTVHLSNLTIEGGDISESGRDGTNGGIILLESEGKIINEGLPDEETIYSTSSLVLDNVNFSMAKAENGGAIYAMQGWALAVYANSSFSQLEATQSGGAISIDDALGLDIQGARFTDNTALEGGAVFAHSTQPELFEVNIMNSRFTANRAYTAEQYATTTGGALHICCAKSLTISAGTEFVGNSSNVSAGALYAETIGIFTIEDSSFRDNEAKEHYGEGGAIQCTAAAMYIRGSLFEANRMGGYEIVGERARYGGLGGAIYFMQDNFCCAGGSITPEVEITGSTFKNNKSYGDGGAVYGAANSPVTITSDFYGNTGVTGGGALWLQVSGGFKLSGSRFERNSLSGASYRMYGGAAYIAYESSDCGVSFPENLIVDSSFKDNHILGGDPGNLYPVEETRGGALYIESLCSKLPARIVNTEFTGNGIDLTGRIGDGVGGAIFCGSGLLDIEGSVDKYILFRNNSVVVPKSMGYSSGGGAIGASYSPKVDVRYALFDNNYVHITSTAIYIPARPARATMKSATPDSPAARRKAPQAMEGESIALTNASVTWTPDTEPEICQSGGGAIMSNMGSIFLKKTTFSDNKLTMNSIKGICVSGGGALHAENAQIMESTFVANRAELKAREEIRESGGGAIYMIESTSILNTTITGNSIEAVGGGTALETAGGGVCTMAVGMTYMYNNIVTGNYQGTIPTDPSAQDDISTGDCACNDNIYMVHNIYGKLYLGDDFMTKTEANIRNTMSDIDNVFDGEWANDPNGFYIARKGTATKIFDGKVMEISRTGAAALNGTLTGFMEKDADCCYNQYFPYYVDKESGTWKRVTCDCDTPQDLLDYPLELPFDKGGVTPYGLTNGTALTLAQNEVDRFAFSPTLYNAGAYALTAEDEPEPEPEPDLTMIWSVTTAHGGVFADVPDGTTTTVTQPTPVYVQIRPSVEGELEYDHWTITYSAAPSAYYYPISGTLSAGAPYGFNEGMAHTEIGNYTYTVNSVTLYHQGTVVLQKSFPTPYTNHIVIKEKVKDPEPPKEEWPPVLPPDPENPDPDPNPDAWIFVRPLAPFCYTDGYLVVTFDLNYKQPLEYAVAFTDAAKAAGFEDVPTYKDLPKDGVITIPVKGYIRSGVYYGYLLLREKGYRDLEYFPFRIEVVEYVKIVEHPVSASQYCKGDEFTLSVKATGDVLSYQWYLNKKKIEGATNDTYTNVVSDATVGDYYVKVTSYCNVDSSKIANVGLNNFRTLIKWDDVLYVTNLDNRFVKFQWYKNGQPITRHGNAIYYTDPDGLSGSYYLRAYTSETEYIESCPIDFPIHSKASGSTSVYPNPVRSGSMLTIETSGVGESYAGARVDLYNMSGVRMYTTTLDSPRTQVQMAYPTGFYLFYITYPSGKVTVEKVVVK